MEKETGFTLVEIAIVLVIIGLILAAVLKGQEMITQGKIKGIINDFNAVLTAYNGYQDRYKAIPGDDPNSGARWTTLGVSGNGNGTVDGEYNDATGGTSEATYFWADLKFANFFPGLTDTAAHAEAQPSNSVGGIIGVQNNALGMSGLSICMSAVVYKIAQSVDTQIDDGNAMTGSVRATVQTAGATLAQLPDLTGGAPAANYVDGSTYVICRSIP